MTGLAGSPSEPALEPASTPDPTKRLVVEELCVDFGGLHALDAVSLHAEQREVLGVIGPNGAGKTTLFNAVCGFVRPRTGSISYGGATLGRRHRPHDLGRLGIARTLQGVGLCRHLTALENVMLGAHTRLRCDFASALLGLRRSSREERGLEARAMELLDRLGVAAAARRPAGTLPYGTQKRVALARALVAEPSLLLLDEPASGLSEDEMDKLAQLIRELAGGLCVVLVEHRMDLVNAVCDRVTVLNFGHVIADGTPQEIRSNPEVTTAYLGQDVERPSDQAAARAGADEASGGDGA